MADAINSHPDIFIPSLELPVFEERFFSTVGMANLDRYLARGAGKITGLKRPDYLGLPGVAVNLASTYPDAKILAVLRDPIDRFVSAAHWYMYSHRIPVQPLSELAERVKSRRHTWRDDRLASDPYVQLLRFGAYHHCLTSFLNEFPKHAVRLTFQESLNNANVQGELNLIWDYLGVAGHTRPALGRTRANSVVYDLRRLRFLSRRPATFSWEQEEEFRYISNRWKKRFDKVLVCSLFQLADRLILSRVWSETRPQTTPDLLAWLVDFYAPQVENLGTLTPIPGLWRERYLGQP